MALNKPFTDSHSRGTKQPCWRARDALGWDKQSKLPFYIAGAPSIQPKLSKIWKQRQWCRNFRKSFQKFWKLLISEMRTIQPKILEILGAKLNGKETSGKRHFRKFGYTSRGFRLVWKFWKMLFHSLLEVTKNSNRTFWLNGKGPWCTCTHGCFLPWLTAKGLLAGTNAI